MILSVEKVEKSFGARVLFSGASFQVNPRDRYALVGPNGAGKTTLLKIIMGQDAPDAGTITFAKDVNVGYLEQETQLAPDVPVIDEVVASANEIRELGERAEHLQQMIAEAGEAGDVAQTLLNEYGQVLDRFERLGGYELESNARQILAGLGFPVEDFGKLCAEFSGGWQMRIALAKLFLRHPDVLLLDEPTNHLDLVYQKQVFTLLTDWLRADQGRAILSVVHDLSLARAYGTDALLLDAGRVRAAGRVDEVFAAAHLDAAYRMDVSAWMRHMLGQWAGPSGERN